MEKLLVVDDDPLIHATIRSAFKDHALEVITTESAEEGIDAHTRVKPDVILLDVMLPDASGLEVYKQIKAKDEKTPVIFITTSNTSETAIEAMKLGAFDYLLKPLDLVQVEELVEKALEIRRLMKVSVSVEEVSESTNSDTMLGGSAGMQEVYKAIGRVASKDVTVLVRGESGTGKELVARAIYQHSDRSSRPFLAINCAAIPENLLESELFGHEKGSFTGADQQRIGKFEQCAGGTLFLDEIGDMPLKLQSKILRVLQERKFERVGGREVIDADIRIIAATHQDLEQAIADGDFRADLFYRLNVYAIEIVPLRDREGDLPLLVEFFLGRFGEELGKKGMRITDEARQLLADYSWPGNVRELQSIIKRAIINAGGNIVVPDDIPPLIPASQQHQDLGNGDLVGFIRQHLEAGTPDLHAEAISFTEKMLLESVMEFTGGNQSRAAKVLGITRGSVRNKLRTLEVDMACYLPESEKTKLVEDEAEDD